MTIDIVIPTFNRAVYLEQAIKSVLLQTDNRYKLYVLDNRSSDNTEEVVKKYECHGVTYIKNEKNLGMVGNWNMALNTGSNELLHIFHDDDLLEPSFVLEVNSFYEANDNIAFVHTGATIVDSNGKNLRERIIDCQIVMSGDDFLLKYLTTGVSIICPSVVINRKVVSPILNYDGNLPFTADINYYVRASKYGAIGYIPKKLIKYRVHSSSATHGLVKNADKKILDRFHYARALEAEIKSRRLPETLKQAAPKNYLCGALSADIWFARRSGAGVMECLLLAKIIRRAYPNITLYHRYYFNILKSFVPRKLIDMIARRLNKSI